MANILGLKRRIQAAKNVSKTTRAMQMIAASKLKRAQEAITSTRPYVKKISQITHTILQSVDEKYTHVYLNNAAKNDKTLLIIMSPDKGLSGSLVTNLIKEFIKYNEHNQNTKYIVVGKKLENQIIHFNKELIASFPFGTSLPSFTMIYPLIKLINDYYTTGKVSQVKILTTEFTNVFSQKPQVIDLLPISLRVDETHHTSQQASFYTFEPHPKAILDSLLERYLEMTVYQQCIESYVSEQAARMVAMQNATNNANDIIAELQLEYNKTRQAKITSEILDITGGKTVAHAA